MGRKRESKSYPTTQTSPDLCFQAYFLAMLLQTPFNGRVSDIVGRKPVLYASIFVFTISSALCGAAKTITWFVFTDRGDSKTDGCRLITARFFQGLGGGSIIGMSRVTFIRNLRIRADLTIRNILVCGYPKAIYWSTCGLTTFSGCCTITPPTVVSGLHWSHMGYRWGSGANFRRSVDRPRFMVNLSAQYSNHRLTLLRRWTFCIRISLLC